MREGHADDGDEGGRGVGEVRPVDLGDGGHEDEDADEHQHGAGGDEGDVAAQRAAERKRAQSAVCGARRPPALQRLAQHAQQHCIRQLQETLCIRAHAAPCPPAHLNSGYRKQEAKKKSEQTTAVKPVRPPSRMAAADST